MGAKFESKTHLLNRFFYFGAVFCAFGFKVLEMTYNKKFIQKRYQKTQNFMLISNPLEKILKNSPNKSYKQNKFDEHE